LTDSLAGSLVCCTYPKRKLTKELKIKRSDSLSTGNPAKVSRSTFFSVRVIFRLIYSMRMKIMDMHSSNFVELLAVVAYV